MKILMFGWEYPPYNSGGLGVACQGLARALTQKDVSITFVLPKKMNVDDKSVKIIFADIPNVKLKTVPSLLMPYVTSKGYMELFTKEGNSVYGNSLFEEVLRYAQCAGELAKKESFDIIHAHDWLAFPAGVAAKKATGKPLVVHVHATEFDRSGGAVNQKVYEVEKEGLSHADKVITVSEFTKNIVVDKYGVPERKVSVVHNGIDINDLPSPTDLSTGFSELKKKGYKIVLFIGRITLQKGPDYFIKTAKKVLEYYPKVYFVVAGSGDMQDQIIEEAAAMGISDKVLFVGFLRGEARTAAYQYADLFVMPSVSEPFGITPLESLVLGTPVLISKQSGVSEVLTHVLKADFWDVDEMTDKILSVLEHDSLKSTLQENGNKDANNCTWDKSANECLQVYQSLM